MNIAHYHNHSHDSDFTKLKTKSWAMGDRVEKAIRDSGSFRQYVEQLPESILAKAFETSAGLTRQDPEQIPYIQDGSTRLCNIRAVYYNLTSKDFCADMTKFEDGDQALPVGCTITGTTTTPKTLEKIVNTVAVALDDEGHGFGDLFTDYDPLRILIITNKESTNAKESVTQAIHDAVTAEKLPAGSVSRVVIESFVFEKS